MGDSRQTSAPSVEPATHVLTIEEQQLNADAGSDNWLDLFPPEDDAGVAEQPTARTFVIDPAPSVAAERPPRSRVRRRRHLSRRLIEGVRRQAQRFLAASAWSVSGVQSAGRASVAGATSTALRTPDVRAVRLHRAIAGAYQRLFVARAHALIPMSAAAVCVSHDADDRARNTTIALRHARPQEAGNLLPAAGMLIIAGAARVYRNASCEMSKTVTVLRIPDGIWGVPHIGVAPLLGSVEAIVAVILVAGLARTAPPLVPAVALTPVVPLPSSVRQLSATEAPRTLAATERRAIQAVLDRYRDAMSILNVAGIRNVWPSADAEDVRADLSGVSEQNLEFDRCQISPAGRQALATCAGVIESGFRAGDRRPNVARTRWEFRLEKTANRWMITAVDTIPG